MSNAKFVLSNMTVDLFCHRTSHTLYNHQCLTEFQRVLTEQYWLCFDRTLRKIEG